MPLPKGWTEKRVRAFACSKGSYRTKTISKKKRLLVCCPRGPRHWNPRSKRCRVGMRLVAVQKKRGR